MLIKTLVIPLIHDTVHGAKPRMKEVAIEWAEESWGEGLLLYWVTGLWR